MRSSAFVESLTPTIIRGLSVCIFVLAVCMQTMGQQTYKTFDKYEELYDSIFARSSDEFDVAKQEFSIDVRLRPSFSAPRQVSITRFRDGKFVAYFHKLANENESIDDQVNSLIRKGGSDDVKALSLLLKVSKTDIKVHGLLLNEINDFFRQTSFRKETRITLDGVGFDVWYVDAGNKIRLSLVGGEKFERGESPAITWVRNLFRILENSKRRKSS